jgi:hypothetical protein
VQPTTKHHLTITITIPDVKQMRGTVIAVTKLGLGAANLTFALPTLP